MWFSVDAGPFIQGLLNIIKRWSFMFKQHLVDHVTHRYTISFNNASRIIIIAAFSLNDLAEFIVITSIGMGKSVKDYNGLVEVSILYVIITIASMIITFSR